MDSGISAVGVGPRWQAAAVLFLDAVTAEVVAALEEADVPAVLLKGPAISRWLYEPTEFRPYSDIDLIVPPWRRERAHGVLRVLGFSESHAGTRAGERALHSDTWKRHGVEVDLHVSLLHVNASPGAVWDVMSRQPETIRVAGTTTMIPSEGARALHVAVKAIAGGPADAKAMDDLRRATERLDDAVWKQATGFASQLGAADLFAAGLRLVPRGELLADRLGLPTRGSARLRVMASVRSEDVRIAALRWARLAEAGGPVARLRFLSRELMPSRAGLKPDAGAQAPTGWQVPLAYVRRLECVLRTAPQGYATWRAAVRETGHGIPFGTRLEVLVWAQLARILLRLCGFKGTLRLADTVPRRGTGEVTEPLPDLGVRRTTCLHRAVGRSQYMRRRGIPHEIVLGVTRSDSSFSAHAWVEPPDPHPGDFVVIHRVPR